VVIPLGSSFSLLGVLFYAFRARVQIVVLDEMQQEEVRIVPPYCPPRELCEYRG